MANSGALQNEDEYQAALKAVRPHFEAEPAAGTAEAAHFDALVLLIEEYESKATKPHGPEGAVRLN